MSLQIQMIGTGSAFSKKYFNNNALVTCNGFVLLIDCGATAPRALHAMDIDIDQIDALLITHIHADHVGGLEEFAFRFKYEFKRKIKLFVPVKVLEALWDHSLRGGLENAAEGLTSLQDYFDVIALDEASPIHLSPGLVIEIIRSEHIPDKPSYSVLLNDTVFFSADTTFNPSLLMSLYENQRCKYILHDCQLSSPGLVHACLEELLTLPSHIQRSVYLMHYDDTMEQYRGKTGEMSFIEQHKRYDFD
ncbi:MBL fold metallo-hydrolase [Paenibacillus sp. OAS669]|uniref:MBL fold metallo-hydrolase n=1 Tax=Paenibacillus sp. OAS669 TaxID=2663821 RepID=UPI00178A1513|nr:MBL fold metallo-hydrolase [Paenibacillus sp. OAS669]MBE1446993.1 ribonuclease BN (tRNA processing enzyme) [Paenibacillus sp. OAS669]